MPKGKRCKTIPRAKKENYCIGKNTTNRNKKITISDPRKTRGIHIVDSSISLAEPFNKKKRYAKVTKSRGKSKCTCNKNGITAKRKDHKTHHNIPSVSDFSGSMDSFNFNHTSNPLKYKESVITVYSSDSCCNADFNSRSKHSMSQFKLDNIESQKYRAIAELEGVKFVKNNAGLTTEISFKPAVVMHVKKKTSTVTLEADKAKSNENIIVVNPSNDLLCELSAGKIQRLYKSGATDLLRQAVDNHSQSITNILNMKKSVNFMDLESQRNISQQNIARNISRQAISSRQIQDSKSNVLQVKSSTNFTNLRFQRNSNMSIHASHSGNQYEEILPPQPIQEYSINSFATLGTVCQGHITGDHSSVVCLTKRDSQTCHGMGDRVSRTFNSRGNQHSASHTSERKR